jgi:hypothetical protein
MVMSHFILISPPSLIHRLLRSIPPLRLGQFRNNCVLFEVVTAAILNSTIFWGVTLCSLVHSSTSDSTYSQQMCNIVPCFGFISNKWWVPDQMKRFIKSLATSISHTVCARSDAGIVGSNPTRVMDICVRLFCVCIVLFVGSGLATGLSLIQGVLSFV